MNLLSVMLNQSLLHRVFYIKQIIFLTLIFCSLVYKKKCIHNKHVTFSIFRISWHLYPFAQIKL